jgi:hypothetical protein
MLDCHILPISADDSSSTIPNSIEDVRIADALDTLSGAPVKASKDEAARALFRLLIPPEQSVFKASRCVGFAFCSFLNWTLE